MSDLLPSPPSSWRARAAALRDGLPLSPATVATGALAIAALAFVGTTLLREPDSPVPAPASRAATPGRSGPWTPPTTVAPGVVVHVAGAVVHPGIQRLAGDARIADAITAAGGPSPDADIDAVNLAARLTDGDRVYVPRRGEVAPPAAAGTGAGGVGQTLVLDLNHATAEQLDTLPGIGPATAQAIVAYRNEHGRFRSVDGLLAVRGIGASKLAALRSRVRV